MFFLVTILNKVVCILTVNDTRFVIRSVDLFESQIIFYIIFSFCTIISSCNLYVVVFIYFTFYQRYSFIIEINLY